jgi:hypothetical protein
MPEGQQIQGLPAGAVVRPIQGLPPGAIMRPISGNATPPAAPPAQPGFLENVGNAIGIHPQSSEQRMADIKEHPVRNTVEALSGPAGMMAEGAYGGGKRILGELGQAGKMAMQGNAPGVASHMISAIPFVGPAMDKMSDEAPPTHPGESWWDQVKADATPGNVGTAIGTAAQVAPMALGAVDEMAPERPLMGQIPTKGRAVRTLNEVSQAAKDVPVQMSATDPAVDNFRQYVATGGRGTPVVNKLVKRMAATDEQGPINFPEARQFYTNVSRATAKPGFLRRAIESPAMPDLRRNLGGVREAMSSDLTDAANSVGMGDKYAEGIREYANAARLNRGLKIGGAVATEEALRRSGILGKVASGAANMAGK